MDSIARAAGVGRMTLYGHFPTRADLVEAAVADALREGEGRLACVDLTGDARQALERLLATSWTLLAESTALFAAAQEVLSGGRIHELHTAPVERVGDLIRRGQREGVFRTDLPFTWMVDVVHHVLHGAAEGRRSGRLPDADAVGAVTATVQAILAVPHDGREQPGPA